MTGDSITRYIRERFDHVEVASAYGDVFFFYNPDPSGPNEIYFATLKVSDDDFDHASGLDRMGAFRLNLGVRRDSFQALFGSNRKVAEADEGGKGYDYGAVDTLLPHPVYSGANWVCILNPSKKTFTEKVAPLLGEAYERAVWQYNRRRADAD